MMMMACTCFGMGTSRHLPDSSSRSFSFIFVFSLHHLRALAVKQLHETVATCSHRALNAACALGRGSNERAKTLTTGGSRTSLLGTLNRNTCMR